MNVYMLFICVTNILYLLRYTHLLTLLHKPALNPVDAEAIYLSHPKKRMYITGSFIGMAKKSGRTLIADRACNVSNAIIVDFSGRYNVITKSTGYIAYGDTVRISGIVKYIGENFVISDIDSIVVWDKESIRRYLTNKYSRTACISAVLVFVLEVIRYVFSNGGWEAIQNIHR